jgi:hypothetical protein
MKPTWKATLLLMATFAGGALAGGAAIAFADRGETRGGHRAHRHDSEDHLRFMTRRLELTADQRDSVEAILGRYKPRMDSIWRQLAPRFETIRDSISTDIRRQLTVEQQTKYTEMLQRFEQERRDRERPDRKE